VVFSWRLFLILFLLWGNSYAGLRPSKYKYLSIQKPKIKVRIGDNLEKVNISGTDLKRTLHVSSSHRKFSGRKRIRFNCQSFTKKNKGKLTKPVLLASVSSQTGLVSLGKVKYQGRLHIVTSPKDESCDVVQEVNLDSYISGLLSKEMNGAWPVEALKAQAVAARTYAIYKQATQQVSRKLGYQAYYDLESSEKHQVAGDFFATTLNTDVATSETSGYILVTDKGNLTETFFHAKCGGKTLMPSSVWKNKVEGYKGVPCPFCNDHGKKNWTEKITKAKMINFLKWAKRKKYVFFKTKNLNKLKLMKDSLAATKLKFYLDGKAIVVKKPLVRRYFGRFTMASNNFRLVKTKRGFQVKGKGLGHGVGMCQLGALDLADRGWDFKQILSHYFPGHKLLKLY
jgi:stage II sporulation protein D